MPIYLSIGYSAAKSTPPEGGAIFTSIEFKLRHYSLSIYDTNLPRFQTFMDSELRSNTCYKPLAGVSERQLKEFRLITLLPDQYPDRIRCCLTVHPLDEPPKYETVSYAWGDPSDTKIIEVDGIELAIPSNLESCLQELRLQLHYPENLPLLPLWTDAICIDQANLEERAVQVENMGTIYRQCSSMYIWLGPLNPSFGDRNPFEMILHWYHDKHFHDLAGFSRTKDGKSWEFVDSIAYQQMYGLFLDGISRPWWERLWCVQEVALCPRAIVRMGTWWIPWSSFLRARENHSRHDSECCKGLTDSMPAKYAYFADPMLLLARPSGFDSIDEIIRSLRHKLCKDPRDKIYGLLALLGTDRSLALRPDYTILVGRLYQQVTEAIVAEADEDLRYLTGSGLGSDDFQLPSWTRNFALPLHPVRASNERTRFVKYRLYRAAAETKSQARIVDDALCLSGTHVDRIERIGSGIEFRDWTHPRGAIPGIQAWAEIAGITDLGKPGPLQERFWRTIMADVFLDEDDRHSRIPALSGAALASWFETVQSSIAQGREPHVTPFVFAFWSATSGRTFFVTKSGNMGLCFPHTRPGDEVWVLAGGNVPFVLRPISDTDDATEAITRSRKIVGECYLNGFMDGEALQKEGDILVSVHLM